MFSKFSAETKPKYISFGLMTSDGPIDSSFDKCTWQQYLEDRFSQATVTVAGYNFNQTIGIHFVTLCLKYNIDMRVEKDYNIQIDYLLNGDELLKDVITNINLKCSRRYNHPNTLFGKYSTNDFKLDCEKIYGDSTALDSYKIGLNSQKHLVIDGESYQQTTQLMLYEYKGEMNQFRPTADSFHKSINNIYVRTLTHFEAYECNTQNDSDLISNSGSESESEQDQIQQCYALIIVQSEESPGTKYQQNAISHWRMLVNNNAKRFNLQEIVDQPRTKLDKIWELCSKVIRIKGAGEFFAEFRKSHDTSHLDYIEQQQQNTLASSHTLKRIKQKQEKSGRMYFCLELENPISTQTCIALSEHLELNDDKFDRINLYYNGDNGQQYLCVYAKADSAGLNRQWFTQGDRKGYKVFNNLSIADAKQLSYTNEQQFFADCNNLSTMYGDSTALETFQKNLQIKELVKAKRSNITKGELIEKFHEGIRNKTYRSIDNLRDEYEDDPRVLEMITKQHKVLDDIVNQFIRLSYDKLPTKSIVVSLQEYVKKHKLQQGEKPLTEQFLKQKGMYDIMQAILEIVVIAEQPKRGTIILHGASNTGKSSIMKIMNEIFICDELLATQGNFDIIPEFKNFKFQIVLSHETNLTKMLDDNHIDNTKRFFEREGKPMEGKGKGAQWLYKGASNILASQYFPLHQLQTLNKDAIATRCRVVALLQSHKDSEKFPLNSRLVADWLLRMYQAHKQKPCVQEVSESDQEDLELTFDQTQHEPEHKPVVLQQAPLLGKRKHQTKTQFNSNKAEKRTKHDIRWGDQTTLNQFIEIEQTEPDVDQLQQEYDEMLPQLRYYYNGKSFPYQLVHRIFQDQFREREFSYYTIKNNKECWKRSQSFMSASDLKETFFKNPPYAVYTGAVYKKPVSIYESIGQAELAMTDLVFDIDMDSYDDRRHCCEGKSICDECWLQFIVPSVNYIQQVLTTDYKYKQLLWTFSGGRGVHLRVFDLKARQLDSNERSHIIDDIKEYATQQGFDLRLDDPVTKDLKRLLRLPFSVHCDKKRLVVPFDPAEVEDFKVSEVPTLQQAALDHKTIDRYSNVLKKYFFPLMVEHTLDKKKSQSFKSDDRNPFLQDNEPLKDSEHDDIWE